MIDPNIWESEDFSELTLLARLVFIGMFSISDDEGRGRANPSYLKNTLFRYDDKKMRLADIEQTLSEIASKMSVTIYEHTGRQYYQFDNWKKWQRVDKPQPSKLPAPPGHSGNGRGTFGEWSGNVRGTVPPNRIEQNRIEQEGAREAHAVDEKLGEVMTHYMSLVNSKPSPSVLDDFRPYAECMDVAVITNAIDRAVDEGKRSKSYILGILRQWKDAKVSCMADVARHDEQWRQKKGDKSERDEWDDFIH